jgi:hypothetical protein
MQKTQKQIIQGYLEQGALGAFKNALQLLSPSPFAAPNPFQVPRQYVPNNLGIMKYEILTSLQQETLSRQRATQQEITKEHSQLQAEIPAQLNITQRLSISSATSNTSEDLQNSVFHLKSTMAPRDSLHSFSFQPCWAQAMECSALVFKLVSFRVKSQVGSEGFFHQLLRDFPFWAEALLSTHEAVQACALSADLKQCLTQCLTGLTVGSQTSQTCKICKCLRMVNVW